MNMQQIFNVLLLTLSLATILLTLVSYILYRIRQIPQSSSVSRSKYRVQGLFFKRYLPKDLREKELPPEAQAPRKPIEFRIPRRVVPFFGVMAGVIFVSLAVSVAMREDTQVGLKRMGAEAFKHLRSKGLLKYYDLESTDAKGAASEVQLEGARKRSDALLADLRKRKVTLVSLPGNEKFNGESAKRALAAWQDFFKRSSIEYSAASAITCDGSLLVIPQSASLSVEERAAITSCIGAGTPVLATGPVGSLDSKGVESGAEWVAWAEAQFGIRFSPAEDKHSWLPVVFRSGGAPGWDVPAGWVPEWKQTDNRYQARPVGGEAAAYESTYKGIARAFTRAQFKAPAAGANGARAVWLAFDPIFQAPAAQEALARSLAWAEGLPSARVSNWPAGLSSATLVSIDSEDQFENAKGVAAIFEKAGIPATFFLVSDLYEKNSGIFGPKLSAQFELASHSEDHSIFAGQALQTQFERIQTSRVKIEELAAMEVRGFRAPEEKYDEATLLAAAQNHFTYFAADAGFQRSVPVAVGSGKMLVFPRMSLDDFAALKRPELTGSEELGRAFVEEGARIAALGGMHLFNMHTQILGLPQYAEALTLALKGLQGRKTWFATYSQAASWWRARDGVETHVSALDAHSVELTVTNRSELALQDVVVEVDPGFSGQFMVINSGSDKSRVPAAEGAWAGKVAAGALAPGESRAFVIKAAN